MCHSFGRGTVQMYLIRKSNTKRKSEKVVDLAFYKS